MCDMSLENKTSTTVNNISPTGDLLLVFTQFECVECVECVSHSRMLLTGGPH